ncbi:3'-5' exonuclease [Flavobacterium sp. N1719]|uniref:3'-5' exonuclease n=1 Tax=Flavobacterium sp. N1719 TaxID=2885633 RepID=UPI002221F786|nr:3'-5' exonuclease [Flavobacterium sp. N1719]
MPYYFNLPLITELTIDQQRAVDENSPLALSGGPGTGKSVVCLWRHIRNHSTGIRNSLLLTYTKTLEHYLRASANTQDEDAGDNIDRVFWWLTHNATDYDEIIIDEGQDIEKAKLERFFNYSTNISYGADERQSMYLTKEKLDELLTWFSSDTKFNDNVVITLNRNFRNSKEILLFTRSVFPNFMIPQNTINGANQTNLKPIMKLNLGWDIEDQVNEIIEIINDFNSDTHNIAILVPFAAQVETFYAQIRENLNEDIEVTKYQNENENFEGLAGVHITTFKSSKGTEFDTVIIPEFDSYSWNIANRPNIVTENDYYVAFTRAKTNLFLICRNNFPNIGDINTVTIE